MINTNNMSQSVGNAYNSTQLCQFQGKPLFELTAFIFGL